jgi:hypothetical protein
MTDVVAEAPAPEPQPVDASGQPIPTPEPTDAPEVTPQPAPAAVQPVVDPAVLEEAVPLAGVKTIDAHEASIGWTAQHDVAIPLEPEAMPGTVVTVAELPSKDSLVNAGVDLDQYFSGLHAAVAADDAERDAIRGVK